MMTTSHSKTVKKARNPKDLANELLQFNFGEPLSISDKVDHRGMHELRKRGFKYSYDMDSRCYIIKDTKRNRLILETILK